MKSKRIKKLIVMAMLTASIATFVPTSINTSVVYASEVTEHLL